MNCFDKFQEIYHSEPEGIAFCPYRICPLGAHVDHQHGLVTGLALDKGIHIAYRTKHNGIIELSSMNFEKRAQFFVNAIPDQKQNDWADYLRGAALFLNQNHPLKFGLAGVIEGSLPIGGLSSSAAVIISFLSALCRVNGITLTKQEMILTALAAENQYVGVACGKLDQSCEVLCKKDHLLYLDTKDDSYELIPYLPTMKPYRIAIFFSGLERSLAGSKFNMRVDECRAAAYALKAYAGMDYGKFNETVSREVPWDVFEQYKDRLPDTWRRRISHFYGEMERVRKGAEAWRVGDLDTFGRLSFESGHSSIELWETGSPELKKLYDIMTETDGIYGGRFSGAGFKGCCMALVDPDKVDAVSETVTQAYLDAFPNLKGKYAVHICRSANGINL